jgi:uncharacterized membrane protein
MTDRWIARILLFCTLLLSVSSAAWSQTPTFQMLVDPTGSGTWVNYALSHDGKVMAANYGGSIFRWTPDTPKFPSGGFTFLGPGHFLNSEIGISSDGTTIITGRTGPDGNVNPALWTQADGWSDLGHPANGCITDGQWGGGYGVNGDGSVAVGLAWYCPGAEGFVWNRTDGMTSLSHPSNGASSRASAISADGRTIVGFFEHPKQGIRRPVLWLAGKAQLFAGTDTPGEATGVTSDGSHIVGQFWDATTGAGGYAFHYTDGNFVSLGTVSGISSDQSYANAVADNGTTVGWSGDPFGVGIEAFIWSPKLGMQSLTKYLHRRGVLLPFGITLSSALDISADGSTIAGVWVDANYNQGGWMVRLKK